MCPLCFTLTQCCNCYALAPAKPTPSTSKAKQAAKKPAVAKKSPATKTAAKETPKPEESKPLPAADEMEERPSAPIPSLIQKGLC